MSDSRLISLKPPLLAFVSGVRIASVITTSSGAFFVLKSSQYETICAWLERLGYNESLPVSLRCK